MIKSVLTYSKILKNTFFEEHLGITTSQIVSLLIWSEFETLPSLHSVYCLKYFDLRVTVKVCYNFDKRFIGSEGRN